VAGIARFTEDGFPIPFFDPRLRTSHTFLSGKFVNHPALQNFLTSQGITFEELAANKEAFREFLVGLAVLLCA